MMDAERVTFGILASQLQMGQHSNNLQKTQKSDLQVPTAPPLSPSTNLRKEWRGNGLI